MTLYYVMLKSIRSGDVRILHVEASGKDEAGQNAIREIGYGKGYSVVKVGRAA